MWRRPTGHGQRSWAGRGRRAQAPPQPRPALSHLDPAAARRLSRPLRRPPPQRRTATAASVRPTAAGSASERGWPPGLECARGRSSAKWTSTGPASREEAAGEQASCASTPAGTPAEPKAGRRHARSAREQSQGAGAPRLRRRLQPPVLAAGCQAHPPVGLEPGQEGLVLVVRPWCACTNRARRAAEQPLLSAPAERACGGNTKRGLLSPVLELLGALP